MICAQCGAEMHQTDKNTFTGRVIRDYECRKCGYTDWQDEGVALWQVMHDAREQEEAEAASTGRNRRPSLWQRLAGRFAGRK